ncbi:uncharacterized protein [Dermacentor andersoni]|uniref:uncharacterized protein n=1 Tax=Dermacentor andersoni TaxID=34620 RepID=UPI003B3AAB15
MAVITETFGCGYCQSHSPVRRFPLLEKWRRVPSSSACGGRRVKHKEQPQDLAQVLAVVWSSSARSEGQTEPDSRYGLICARYDGRQIVRASEGFILPTLFVCLNVSPFAGEQKFRLSDVSVTNATIGRTVTVNFTLAVTEELADDPKMEVTVYRQNGRKISCPPRGGAWSAPLFHAQHCGKEEACVTPCSSVYKLCGGRSNAEKFLGQLWNNECPVPAMERQESASSRLNPMIQAIIGRAPTTITVEYKVKNGGSTVGCQSFKVRVDAA